MKQQIHLSDKTLRIIGAAIVAALVVAGAVFGVGSVGKIESPVGDQRNIIPQFVLFSFDGSRSTEVIGETLDFANMMRANLKPVKFTYFVNAVHFVDDQEAAAKGMHTQVSFGGSRSDVEKRIGLFERALKEGHEMASHAVSHDDGSLWSVDRWNQEFSDFDRIMAGADRAFSGDVFAGFRAPQLGTDRELYSAVALKKFRYDSSGVGDAKEWPKKNELGTWTIPLPMIPFGSEGRRVVSMDYNIWMRQSHARNEARRGTLLWKQRYDETMDAYRRYFESNYDGSRAPVMICNHLYKDWNDEVYWEAMKDIAKEVCGRPGVRCTTYRELVDYLDAYGAPVHK